MNCPFCGSDLINIQHRLSDAKYILSSKQIIETWECLNKKKKFEGKISKEEWENAPEEIKDDYNNRLSLIISGLMIRRNSEDPKAFKEKGIAYYNLKNYKQAISDFSEAISFDPQDGENYYYRGKCH